MTSSRYKIERAPDGITVSARVVHDSQEIGFTALFLIFSFAITCIAPFYLEEHYFTDPIIILIHILFTFYLVGSLVTAFSGNFSYVKTSRSVTIPCLMDTPCSPLDVGVVFRYQKFPNGSFVTIFPKLLLQEEGKLSTQTKTTTKMV